MVDLVNKEGYIAGGKGQRAKGKGQDLELDSLELGTWNLELEI
jgi:hypothetical protein